MNEKYLKILEFDKIKDILSNYAISENAKDKIEKLEPSTRREVIELLLEQTSEAQKMIVTNLSFKEKNMKTKRNSLISMSTSVFIMTYREKKQES